MPKTWKAVAAVLLSSNVATILIGLTILNLIVLFQGGQYDLSFFSTTWFVSAAAWLIVFLVNYDVANEKLAFGTFVVEVANIVWLFLAFGSESSDPAGGTIGFLLVIALAFIGQAYDIFMTQSGMREPAK